MRAALLTTVAALALTPAAALAQEQTPPASTTANDDQGISDIVVTAQRREESLQRAAVPVDVVSGADLVAAGATGATALTQLIPSLVVEPSSTGNLIFMRGVGNFTVVPTSDPAIAFNYDGVYIGRPTSTTGAFYDLARIEVLKGPQGTLYGRNATGGAINVIPNRPVLGQMSGHLTASYGNYDALTVEGAINLPLGERGAVRISGTIVDRDGYLADGTSDEVAQGIRVQAMGEITDNLTVRVAGDYSHVGGFGYSVSYTGAFALNPVAGTYTFVPATTPVSEGLYTPAAQAFRQTIFIPLAGRRLDALAPAPFQDNSFYGFNAELAWNIGIGTLTFIPSFRAANLDYLASAAAFNARQRETDEQYSFELRLAGNRIGAFEYVLGAFYYNERLDYRQIINLPVQTAWIDQFLTTESWAPFARVTAHLNDRLRLVGGIRYTEDDKTFRSSAISGTVICNVRVAGVPSCPTVPLLPLVDNPSQLPFPFPPQGVPALPIGTTGAIISRGDTAFNSTLSDSRITWRAAVEFDVAPRSLLYASVETGYRSGGFSAAVGRETYNPEYITAYTVGMKNRLLGNRLQLDLEAFYWDYRDQQVNRVGLDATGRTSNFTSNVGRAEIYGFEVNARALVTPTTLLSADIAYVHTSNEEYVFGVGAQAPPLTGCPFTLSGAQYLIDCSGFPANNAPRWTVNLAAQQTIPVGNDFQFILGADTQYKSGRYINFYYVREGGGFVDHSWQTNARIAFGPSDDRWSVALYVRNIENNRIPVFFSPAPITNIGVAGTTAPRTYGIQGTIRF